MSEDSVKCSQVKVHKFAETSKFAAEAIALPEATQTRKRLRVKKQKNVNIDLISLISVVIMLFIHREHLQITQQPFLFEV